MPEVFISYSHEDRDVAERLSDALRQADFNVWMDTFIAPGENYPRVIEERLRQADVVAVLVTESIGASLWLHREIEIAALLAQSGETMLVPVVVRGTSLDRRFPYALQSRQAIMLDPSYDPQFDEAARAIMRAYDLRQQAVRLPVEAIDRWRHYARRKLSRPPETGEHLAAVHSVVEVFTAAGRQLTRSEPPELLEPGPVWVAASPNPTSSELERFAQYLRHGRIGYFVHDGELSRDAEIALDQMRVAGTPVVTVTLRALRSALTDQRVAAFLGELEHNYGTKDNLFDTRNALVDERWLFGREVMLNTLGSAIRRHEHVLLTGLRKVGKTSLLNVLRQRLVHVPVCSVDLQRYDRHTEDWPVELFRLMVRSFDSWAAVERPNWLDGLDRPADPSSLRTGSELSDALRLRSEIIGRSVPLVVILDEVERVFPAPGEQEAGRRWNKAAGALRALSQDAARRVVVVGADLRPVANRRNKLDAGTNPFFALFQEMPVPLLDSDAVADMIESLGRAMGVDVVTVDFLERLFALTGGHPSLARTIAGEAFRQRAHPGRMDGRDLARALDHLDDTDSVTFFLRANLWQLMSGSEQRVLRALATRSRLGGLLHRRPKDDDGAYASLTAQGLIDRDGIRIGLFWDWVRAHAEAL